MIIVPYLFRYWLSFWYSLKCYLAQEAGDHQKQRHYYKLVRGERERERDKQLICFF